MPPEAERARESAEFSRDRAALREQVRWMERPSDAIRDKGAPVHPFGPANPDDWNPGQPW